MQGFTHMLVLPNVNIVKMQIEICRHFIANYHILVFFCFEEIISSTSVCHLYIVAARISSHSKIPGIHVLKLKFNWRSYEVQEVRQHVIEGRLKIAKNLLRIISTVYQIY